MRYIPVTPADRQAMLAAIGVGSTDELFADIPAAVRLNRPLQLPGPLSEMEILTRLGELAAKNASAASHSCFLGAGAYDHYVPSVVDHLIRRGEFFTAYTPYQPEIAQGTLAAIYQYQSLICELTGMDLCNASMYDGASALAEGALMAAGITGRSQVVVSRGVHPDYRRVLSTYLSGLPLTVAEVPYGDGGTDLDQLRQVVGGDTACVIVQMPNFFGCLEPVHEIADLVHRTGGLLLVAVNPISLGLLAPPGAYGADIVVAEGQPLGNALSFGGPYLGVMATRDKFARRIPGRIVGATVDNRGQRGFVLTLQTREQHIRREKATSNICTNQALNALIATIYLGWLGKQGLTEVAELCLQKAHYTQNRIAALPGWQPSFGGPFFHEFALRAPAEPARINRALLEQRIIGGYDLGRDYPELRGHLLFAVTEKRTRAEIDALVQALEVIQ